MDDRPMTSDEMIKRAREDLSSRPDITEITGPDEHQRRRIEEIADAETPSVEEMVAAAAPSPTRPRRTIQRRPTRIRRAPDGFGEAQPSSRAIVSVVLALIVLGLGVAAFVVMAASTP